VQQGAAVWVFAASAVLVMAGGWLSWSCRGRSASILDELRTRLPDSAAGWNAAQPATLYDPESIYDYIDGHAEGYLAYGMTACLAQRYRAPRGERDLVLDIFELASAADAFGVFTHDTDGEPAGIGRGSRYRYGWLSFWQDSYFVSIVAEEESAKSRAAAEELGRAVAGLLPDAGDPPRLVTALPAEELEKESVRFLRTSEMLNTHLFLDGDNILQLGSQCAAALGIYRRGEERAYLLLVDYPDLGTAETAASAFRQHFQGDSAETSLSNWQERGWYGAHLQGHQLGAVLEVPSRQWAEELLTRVTRALGGGE
jgi:hypothetical protein